ncbi:hypothetical protein AWZ03_011264 [Drosophila navojoa]|uniref:EB domain-containing protein n=1 Tax=Drosophila navojoa TaxID=7232 RepID=A0A484B2L4_DRONA|nr:platelet endothelial aggregation receptor 1 [Drosophila navojoa]TDG42310.1 hypothetical protein AWZ03_011264 [Drosophila navojoa]
MRLLPILSFVFYALNTISAEDLLELSCLTDEQCMQFEGGKCLDSRCICTARGGGSEERVDCQPKDEKRNNIIGGPCPCTLPHAECDVQTQQCFCAVEYLPSDDRRRCLPVKVPLDDSCEMARQCQSMDTFANCQTKRCICQENFVPYEGDCLSLLDLSCSDNTICETVDAAICLPQTAKCACAKDLVANQNRSACIPGVDYAANCTNSAQCQVQLGAGSTCDKDNRCSCSPTHYAKRDETLNSTVCELRVPYGAYCRRTADCLQMSDGEDKVLNSRMECKWGECQCRAEFQVMNNEYCVVKDAATANQLSLFLPILSIWPIYSVI